MTFTIDFSKFKSAFESEEAFQQSEQEERQAREKFFKPGRYELEVKAFEPATKKDGTPNLSSDPTWIKMQVVFGGAGEKEHKHLLFVPTATEFYTGEGKKPTKMMFHKFKNYAQALGIPVECGPGLAKTLMEYFSNPADHIGYRVCATMGYDAAHNVIVRPKSDPEGLLLKLVDKNEKDILGEDGNPVTANTTEALILHCKTSTPEIKYNGFVQILEFAPSSTPNEIKSASKTRSPF